MWSTKGVCIIWEHNIMSNQHYWRLEQSHSQFVFVIH